MLRQDFRIVLWPTLLSAGAVVASGFVLRDHPSVQSATMLGLLSQFNGTATSVLAAFTVLSAPRPDSAPERLAAFQRRAVQLRFAAVLALIAFVLVTAGVVHPQLGSWGTATTAVTVMAIGWALVSVNSNGG